MALIRGTSGADALNGGADDDQLYGEGGNDTLYEQGGSNLMRGGEGDDALYGGSGFDDMHGNVGDDTLWGAAGGDWVVGGQGYDVLYAHDGDDVVYGNLGDDTLYGDDGNDWVRGGQGADSLSAGAGDDFIAGDRGDDTILGGAGADTFHAFHGAGVDRILDFDYAAGDRIQLEPGPYLIYLTAYQSGADTIVQYDGTNGGQVVLVGVDLASLPSDWFSGAPKLPAGPPSIVPVRIRILGAREEIYRGTSARDVVFGFDGSDLLHGGPEADTIHGGAGNDEIFGDSGRDWLFGGDGNDWIDAYVNNGFVSGDAGDDLIVVRGRWGQEPVGQLTVVGGEGDDQISVPQYDYAALGGQLVIDGGPGEDRIGARADTSRVPTDIYVNHAPTGASIVIHNVEQIRFHSGRIHGGDTADWLALTSGLINGGGGNDTLEGGIYGPAIAEAVIFDGGVGDDSIWAGDGPDSLMGGSGADTLRGHGGADTLSGGAGADHFWFTPSFYSDSSGSDIILDFSYAEGDRLHLPPNTTYVLSQGAFDLVMMVGDQRLLLYSVHLSSLPPDWVIFG